MSDASPDVEGIETTATIAGTMNVTRQMHRPMLRALKLAASTPMGDQDTSQMHRPMLRALKRLSPLRGRSLVRSDASPDVEGIETYLAWTVLLLSSVRCIARC